MRLSIKGLALAGTSLGRRDSMPGIDSSGQRWLRSRFPCGHQLSLPGLHGARSFGDAVLGGIYAFIDGSVGGLVFAWLYNAFAGQPPRP